MSIGDADLNEFAAGADFLEGKDEKPNAGEGGEIEVERLVQGEGDQ